MPSLKLGLISLTAAMLALGTPMAAHAATSGGVSIALSCGTLPKESGTFMVTANGAGSVITVPCGGVATATNAAWTAGSVAFISLVAQPVGTALAIPFTSRVLLTTGVVNVSMSAIPIPSGGVKITLTCEAGQSATFRVTANESSSVVSVPCGGSATVANKSWTSGASATIDLVSAPKGTYLFYASDIVLGTQVVAATTKLARCPNRGAIKGCPPPDLGAGLLGLLSWYVVALPFVVLLTFIVLVPFEFSIIRGWIRFFSRKTDPRSVIEDLSARPGLGWWVRRYVGWVRMKHKLFGVPLPPSFDQQAEPGSSDRQSIAQ